MSDDATVTNAEIKEKKRRSSVLFSFSTCKRIFFLKKQVRFYQFSSPKHRTDMIRDVYW